MPNFSILNSIPVCDSKVAICSNPVKQKKQKNKERIKATIWFSVKLEAKTPIETYTPERNIKPMYDPVVAPQSRFP